MSSHQKLAYIYAFLSILCWSTVASAFKISLRFISPFQLLFYASLTATSVLFIFVLFRIKNIRKTFHKYLLYSAFLGFINPFVYYLILFEAYDLLPAQIAQPLNYTWPIVLSVFSVLFLNQEFKLRYLFSILVSFVGIILLSFYTGSSGSKSLSLLGIFLALLSAFVWSTYWILSMKRLFDPVVSLFFNFLFGTMYSAIFLLLNGISFHIPNIVSALSMVYVGIFEMGLTFVLWLKALSHSSSTSVISNLVYLSPFVSLIFIHYVVGEKIKPNTVYGLSLIIFGILIQSIKIKRVKQ